MIAGECISEKAPLNHLGGDVLWFPYSFDQLRIKHCLRDAL